MRERKRAQVCAAIPTRREQEGALWAVEGVGRGRGERKDFGTSYGWISASRARSGRSAAVSMTTRVGRNCPAPFRSGADRAILGIVHSPVPYSISCGRGRVKGTRMSKSTRNSGTAWTPQDDRMLQELAAQNTPTRVIGLKLGRTPAAIYTHASETGVSLKPTNQSPYGRK